MSNEIIKHCLIHGDLTIEQVNKSGTSHGTVRYKCKLCVKKVRVANYAKTRVETITRQKKYRKDNRLKVNKIRRESNRRNRHKHVAKVRKYKREQSVRRCKELHDSYIRYMMAKRCGLKAGDMPENLVKLKRVLMLLRRRIRSEN